MWKRWCRERDGGIGRDNEKRQVALDLTRTQTFEVVMGIVKKALH